MARQHGFQDIAMGDRVTILVPAGGRDWRERTGTAAIVTRAYHGGPITHVALNMGGPHGTPGVATPENFVRVAKRRGNPGFSYPRMAEQVGSPQPLMVRPNPPKTFQRIKVTPRSKWMKGVSNATEAINMFTENAKHLAQESFWVVPMDTKNAPLGFIEVTRGLVDASLVSPREVFQAALTTGAAQIMVFHNHPSGDPHPSGADHAVTRKLQEAGRLMEIPLLDHVVVGAKGYYSFAESGAL